MGDDVGARLRIAGVLPVGDNSPLLFDCLQAIRGQERPLDELIVVDDSPDGSLLPQPGARLLRSHGRGPYAARNVGWRAADSDVVLFLDVRSRPRAEWARRLSKAFEDPAVALASSNVVTRAGDSLGARVSAHHQFFIREKYVERAFFRPYAPTCNLAVRRSELEQAGGFDEVRSGGDADLCWRILREPGRRLESLHDDLMDWIPRDRVRDYLEQSYRYGGSHYALRKAWAAEGADRPAPISYGEALRQSNRIALQATGAVLKRRRSRVVECLLQTGRLAYQVGYRRAADADHPAARP